MQIDESEDEKKYHELFQKALLEKQTENNGRSYESTNLTTSCVTLFVNTNKKKGKPPIFYWPPYVRETYFL
jgi:hypothetical protein